MQFMKQTIEKKKKDRLKQVIEYLHVYIICLFICFFDFFLFCCNIDESENFLIFNVEKLQFFQEHIFQEY